MEVVPLLYDYPYYSENYFRDWDFPKLEYYLLSTLPPKRTKVLDGTSFSLELDPGDSLETLKTIYLGGDFLGKSGSKLLFNTSFVSKRKETDPKLGNDIEFSQENNVRYADYRYNPHILKVDANKIISLQCNSQSREKIFNTGIVISTLSAITTLVIAPLVSMNYKTGKINSATYLTVAGIGLAGWTVNIPLMTIFRSKVYNLSYNSPDSYMYDDNWRIYKRFKNKKDRTD
jgi:hypothetical protein